ncbi:MAG: hypothetical protein HYZ15_13085 [Sphingobacteriales bacterium]|nr:hypothetical protein [Sphingobacteriales bacterium]
MPRLKQFVAFVRTKTTPDELIEMAGIMKAARISKPATALRNLFAGPLKQTEALAPADAAAVLSKNWKSILDPEERFYFGLQVSGGIQRAADAGRIDPVKAKTAIRVFTRFISMK